MALIDHPAYKQLEKAGYINYLAWIEEVDGGLEAWAATAFLQELRNNKHFVEGIGFLLHLNMGKFRELTDFRSDRNYYGPGALQIVYNKKTLRIYADVDNWSPIDVVGTIMHGAEVIRNRFRRKLEVEDVGVADNGDQGSSETAGIKPEEPGFRG